MGYNTNLGLAGKYMFDHGVTVSLKRTIHPKVNVGLTVRYLKHKVSPDPEKYYGRPVAGFGVVWNHCPLTGLVEYQLTEKKFNPYLGLETGLFINQFKAIPSRTTLKRNTSLGFIPKVGIRTTFSKVGVFVEGLYLWQTVHRFEHENGTTDMRRGYWNASLGVTFSL
ncbi:hypothetical protein GCM10027347_51480 [Larkinella harenae]